MLLSSAYFDESTDEGSADRCYTVAGFVGNGHAVLDLDMRWGELLERYDLEYFKASEIEFGFGEFLKHRDDPTKPTDPLSTKEKGLIREIKTAFIDLICDCDEMVGVGAVLILPDYERLLQDSSHAKQVLPRPYVICADFVLLEVGIMANEETLTTPPEPWCARYSIGTKSTWGDFSNPLRRLPEKTLFLPSTYFLRNMKTKSATAAHRRRIAWRMKLVGYLCATSSTQTGQFEIGYGKTKRTDRSHLQVGLRIAEDDRRCTNSGTDSN